MGNGFLNQFNASLFSFIFSFWLRRRAISNMCCANTALHRRIVALCRNHRLLRGLLALGGFGRKKQLPTVFLSAYPTSPARRSHNPTNNEKSSPNGLLSILVAETGFEPRDLRVMSPTSYQAAPLRDIYGAGNRDRTGTGCLVPRDFKSRASANFAIPARGFRLPLG